MTEFEQPLYGEEVLPEVSSIDQKIYTQNQIRLCTFLGGPLVAGYMAAENFRAFNEYDKAKKTWMIAIGVTFGLFAFLFLLPENVHIPNVILPLILAWLSYILVNSYQGGQIKQHFRAGGQTFNWSRAVVVMLIGAAVTIVFFMIGAFAIDAVSYFTGSE